MAYCDGQASWILKLLVHVLLDIDALAGVEIGGMSHSSACRGVKKGVYCSVGCLIVVWTLKSWNTFVEKTPGSKHFPSGATLPREINPASCGESVMLEIGWIKV